MKLAIGLLFVLSLPAWAKLQFESTYVEAQLAAGAEQGTALYHFTNTGPEPATISRVIINCDCLTAEASGGKVTDDGRREYAAGEKGMIRMSFKVGNTVGSVDQAVGLLMLGDPKDQPSITLAVRFIIPELVLLEPKTLKWLRGAEPTTRKIVVTMQDPAGIQITKLSATSEDYQLELKTIEAGRSYEILVTPKHIDTLGSTIIEIHTDCKVEKQGIQQVFAMVMSPSP